MLGKVFGKRPAAAASQQSALPPHPGPDRDGVTRVIPSAIWDGPQGEFLRRIGLSPNDASNFVMTPQIAQARADALKNNLGQFVESVNKDLPPGTTVVPWALFPWSMWKRRHGNFLIVSCELYPCAPQNTWLLPADAHSAAVLGLPKHPQIIPPGLEDAIDGALEKLQLGFQDMHKRAAGALSSGNTTVFSEYADAHAALVRNVSLLAQKVGVATFGEKAAERHEQLWGNTIVGLKRHRLN